MRTDLHVAVLMGGWSAEREVSLVSGAGVADACEALGWRVTRVDMDRSVAAAIAEIASRGCRFLAFGRVIDGKFTVLSDLMLPPALAAICDEVPAAEFREDVSSTELRNGLANS